MKRKTRKIKKYFEDIYIFVFKLSLLVLRKIKKIVKKGKKIPITRISVINAEKSAAKNIFVFFCEYKNFKLKKRAKIKKLKKIISLGL